MLDYDADVHEGTRIAMDESFDEARGWGGRTPGALPVPVVVVCFSALRLGPTPQAKRARVEEANRRLAEGVERTRERALARAARHSYVLEQRRQAREHAERERREREKREAAAKKEALLREERRAKAAMEEMLARAKKEAAEEVKAIQKMADGPAKLARIRKIRAKYHPDKNLPGEAGARIALRAKELALAGAWGAAAGDRAHWFRPLNPPRAQACGSSSRSFRRTSMSRRTS